MVVDGVSMDSASIGLDRLFDASEFAVGEKKLENISQILMRMRERFI
jgi:hypothetical protein